MAIFVLTTTTTQPITLPPCACARGKNYAGVLHTYLLFLPHHEQSTQSVVESLYRFLGIPLQMSAQILLLEHVEYGQHLSSHILQIVNWNQ